jgi:hypothetical protein
VFGAEVTSTAALNWVVEAGHAGATPATTYLKPRQMHVFPVPGFFVHNVLMLGSPGAGKSMLAQRLPTILPPLTPVESLETTRVYSAVGRLPPGEALLNRRPFRTPHHTISDVSS